MTEHACQDLLGRLSDYIEGELAEELCRELERHLASCENCRVVVNTLEKTVALYRSLPAPEMPDETQDRLFKVLKLDQFRARGG